MSARRLPIHIFAIYLHFNMMSNGVLQMTSAGIVGVTGASMIKPGIMWGYGLGLTGQQPRHVCLEENVHFEQKSVTMDGTGAHLLMPVT